MQYVTSCVSEDSRLLTILTIMLLDLMAKLGLSVSEKKLVMPSTQAVCLGILIDSQNGTISIPPEKLEEGGVHQTSTSVASRIIAICPQVCEASMRFSESHA